jgi:hypothetical protein
MRPYGTITQKITFWIFAGVETSNLKRTNESTKKNGRKRRLLTDCVEVSTICFISEFLVWGSFNYVRADAPRVKGSNIIWHIGMCYLTKVCIMSDNYHVAVILLLRNWYSSSHFLMWSEFTSYLHKVSQLKRPFPFSYWPGIVQSVQCWDTGWTAGIRFPRDFSLLHSV